MCLTLLQMEQYVLMQDMPTDLLSIVLTNLKVEHHVGCDVFLML